MTYLFTLPVPNALLSASALVPDWNAIGALASAGAVIIAMAALLYSIRTLRTQLRHQTDLEAKHLEQELLLRVMDVAQAPYEASKTFVADIMAWRHTGGPKANPEFFMTAGKAVSEEHNRLSTATSAVLHVLRRSRPRRFPRGTADQAFQSYYDLVQRVLQSNARMLRYMSTDVDKFDLLEFQNNVGTDAVQMADLLRRYTGELLARMYSEDQEWSPIEYKPIGPAGPDGGIPFDFADQSELGRKKR